MKIEGVVISCYRFDLELTRLCVASIRFWYPQIPIWLLKDRQYGDFSTRDIERYWNVQIHAGRQKNLGWGFGKLEVMTELPARRLLFIDSDIVFAGRVIDRLEQFEEDFIVVKENHDAIAVEKQFFPPDKLRQFDPGFEFKGYGFNGGQIVATTGRITKQDFEGLVDWQTRTVKHPDIFQMGDQGMTNYVILRKVQNGQLTLRRESFMVWPGEANSTKHIQVKDFTPEGRHRELIHWAGLRWGKTLKLMPRSDILLHFQKIYYARVRFGRWLQRWRRTDANIRRAIINRSRRLAKWLLLQKRRDTSEKTPG
jgi:hypothetical protein